MSRLRILMLGVKAFFCAVACIALTSHAYEAPSTGTVLCFTNNEVGLRETNRNKLNQFVAFFKKYKRQPAVIYLHAPVPYGPRFDQSENQSENISFNYWVRQQQDTEQKAMKTMQAFGHSEKKGRLVFRRLDAVRQYLLNNSLEDSEFELEIRPHSDLLEQRQCGSQEERVHVQTAGFSLVK